MPWLSDHERRVREMMSGFGQAVPELPTVSDGATRVARAAMLLEEVLEYAEAAGLGVFVRHEVGNGTQIDVELSPHCFEVVICGEPRLPDMIDAVADISVVNCGTAAAHGTRLAPVLEAVDANNLMKVAGGKLNEQGKFIKPVGHKPPDIEFVLRLQGWQPADEARECDGHTESSRSG